VSPSDTKTDGVTLATIARAMGVSRTTVSNAYNRPDQLSAELRARVLETAKRLGYHGPDPVARTLRRGRTGSIGIVFDEALTYAFTDPAQVEFLQGVAGVCELQDSGLLLVPGALRASGHTVIGMALVDGFVIHSLAGGDPRIEAVEERGLPFVIVEGPPHPTAPSVGIDNRGGATAIIRHLLGLGHRRFGIISLPLSPGGPEGPASGSLQESARYDVTRDRLIGYREALEAAGISWNGVPVDTRINRFRSGGLAAAAMLDRKEPPTAIVAMSDELALGALAAAAERGMDVPRDLSVVGFDDAPSARRGRPALTTVRQPLAEKGAAAARLLLGSGSSPEHVVLATEPIVRDSSGPAPRTRKETST
jgi:DNA-binding LacI/PurR family transcriptional regulator